jgi:hypothetical protein
MDAKTLAGYLNLGAAAAALVAAVLWWYSTSVSVPFVEKKQGDLWLGGISVVDGQGVRTDPFGTAMAQGRWSRWAAMAAAVAAALQGVALLLAP